MLAISYCPKQYRSELDLNYFLCLFKILFINVFSLVFASMIMISNLYIPEFFVVNSTTTATAFKQAVDTKNDITPKHTDMHRFVSLGQSNHSSLEKGVWFYANYYRDAIPLSIVEELLARNFNTIYFAGTTTAEWNNVSIASKYIDFINYARSHRMNVFVVTLEDPDFAMKSESTLRLTFEDFISATDRLFDTYIVDVEPHSLPGADPCIFIPQYIRMSAILAKIASEYDVKYIDTVPTWYNTAIIECGISSGLDILSSNSLILMDYTNSTKQTLYNLRQIRSDEIDKSYVVSIKITPGHGSPQLMGKEIPRTIQAFQAESIPIALYEARYTLKQNVDLFR